MPKRSLMEREARQHEAHMPEPEDPTLCLQCQKRKPMKRMFCERCWDFGIELLAAQRIADARRAQLAAMRGVAPIEVRYLRSLSQRRRMIRTLTVAAVVQVVRERGPLTETDLRGSLRNLGYRCGPWDFRGACSDAEEWGVEATHRYKNTGPYQMSPNVIISTKFTYAERS